MTTAIAPDVARAQDAFVEQLRPLLATAHRLAYGMLQGSHEAEDAVQEAIFKAWRARGRLRPGSELRPWFLQIVANECRQRRRSRWWSVLKGADVPERSAGDHAAGSDAAADLGQALRRLSHDQRLALVLRYYLDLPLDEVGRALGVSEHAAKARVHRALVRLRLELAGGEDG
jgi:RNA polymerase sigma factor (sigma-70 family)